MGCCTSQLLRTKKIEAKIWEEKKISVENERKLLLLGTGASGKSTVFKNLRRSRGEVIAEPATTMETVWILRQTLVETMVKLLMRSKVLYEENKEQNADCLIEDSEEIIKHAQLILKTGEFTYGEQSGSSEEELVSLGDSLAYLWKLRPIQATFAKRGRFAYTDNADYFFEKATEVFHPKFLPTEEDFLKARVRTTGYFIYIKKKVFTNVINNMYLCVHCEYNIGCDEYAFTQENITYK
ncbi:hypothetical protein RFI_26631, partial [Reticulomyxa filosa]